jgi:hypothetical protein
LLAVPARRKALGEPRLLSEVGLRVEEMLWHRGTAPRWIVLAESLAMAYPDQLGAPFCNAAESPDTTAAARRLAGRFPPAEEGMFNSARACAIRYLAGIADRESLPELRRSLEAKEHTELLSAIKALGALYDEEARPALEKLARDDDAKVAETAKAALER